MITGTQNNPNLILKLHDDTMAEFNIKFTLNFMVLKKILKIIWS